MKNDIENLKDLYTPTLKQIKPGTVLYVPLRLEDTEGIDYAEIHLETEEDVEWVKEDLLNVTLTYETRTYTVPLMIKMKR